MINWEDLSQKTRDYFDSRFANHGMDGETAFNHPKIIPIKSREELDSDAIEQLLREKEISHVMSQANNPLSPPCIPPKFVLHGLSSKSKFLAVSRPRIVEITRCHKHR